MRKDKIIMERKNENYDIIIDKIIDNHVRYFSEYKAYRSKNKLVIPDFDFSVEPQILSIDEKMVSLGYRVNSPLWDMGMSEICVGMGPDANAALGMADGSFIFGLMDALIKFCTGENPESFESKFLGNTHKWKAYIGNICGMASEEDREDSGAYKYWEILKDDIAKRIGNQKLCYVKIYAANTGAGETVGEVRINNLKCEELSKSVEEIAKGWNNKSFKSEKQFVILKQEEETTIPYPYTENDIYDKVVIACKLAEKCYKKNDYDVYDLQRLQKLIKDADLSDELYLFIPEICAEDIFEISSQDIVAINYGSGGLKEEFYKTQIYSYSMIKDSIFRVLESGLFSEPNGIYMTFVSMSSICNIVEQMRNSGENVDDFSSICLVLSFGMSSNYHVR